jgi:hypothetical protein
LILRPLYLLEKSLGTHWIGGSVGLGAGLVAVERRIYLPLAGIEPRFLDFPACSLVRKGLINRKIQEWNNNV